MIVVADTSVILNLCCVNQQEILSSLFRDVVVPPEVRHEFERAVRVYPRFAGLVLPGWIKEQAPSSIPDTVRDAPRLDAGEMAAIALALEITADAVLIDETDGRQAARQHGLIAIGVLGVLVRARHAGLITAVAPIIEQLEQRANFWVRPEIRLEVLRLVGEAN